LKSHNFVTTEEITRPMIVLLRYFLFAAKTIFKTFNEFIYLYFI
jgi:hypothetical protein